MIGNSGDKILPVHTCKRKLANYFITFFYNKILNIRSELVSTDTHTGGSVTNCFSGVLLNTFMDATEAEIWNIIKLLAGKFCELDSLPTWLLKECIAELVLLITDIVNMSLRESTIPKSLKTTLIRPFWKKTGLDTDILKKFRPVSNLTFISKLIEKVISGTLNEHLTLLLQNYFVGFKRNLNMSFATMCWLFCYCFLIIFNTTVHHISNVSEDM